MFRKLFATIGQWFSHLRARGFRQLPAPAVGRFNISLTPAYTSTYKNRPKSVSALRSSVVAGELPYVGCKRLGCGFGCGLLWGFKGGSPSTPSQPGHL